MTALSDIGSIYFLGIGGIGMSALARYFNAKGYMMAGYDRTVSPLTRALETEGVHVVYDGQEEAEKRYIAQQMPRERTLVVRTPAVPEDEEIYSWLREQGYDIVKRAELLGIVSRLPHNGRDGEVRQTRALCVAGTHGKTTTSTMLAHIMHDSSKGASAFLGGISNNTGSNLMMDSESEYVVIEADEFDRSFHRLSPYMSVVTSIDPDHLDIYGTAEGYHEGFEEYAGLVESVIVRHKRCRLRGTKAVQLTYSADEDADFCAKNIHVEDGVIVFDIQTPDCVIKGKQYTATLISGMRLHVPAWVNIENAVGAVAIAWLNGVTAEETRRGIASFKGVYRRFDKHIDSSRLTYIDDYAHHPTELQAALESIRRIYPARRLTAVFQPHLYSRTRDFMDDFAAVLSRADELLLLPIYPAREQPIEGVTSEALAARCRQQSKGSVAVVEKAELAERLAEMTADGTPRVVMTLGAGDIDRLVPEVTKRLSER